MKLLPIILFATALPSLADRLPIMTQQPWLNWYAGTDARGFRFGVDVKGEAKLMPFKKSDELVSTREWIEIEPVIEHVLPDGQVVKKTTQEDGFEAITPSGNEAETITYRGTVTGGAKYETTFEVGGKDVAAGGRIIDKGTLTEGTLRFSLRVKIPNAYPHVDDEDKLEDMADSDKIELVLADGKKLKFDGFEPVDGAEITTAIDEAKVDFDGYKSGRVEVESGDGGDFEMWTGGKKSLYKGFSLNWMHDEVKDPQGKARLELTLK